MRLNTLQYRCHDALGNLLMRVLCDLGIMEKLPAAHKRDHAANQRMGGDIWIEISSQRPPGDLYPQITADKAENTLGKAVQKRHHLWIMQNLGQHHAENAEELLALHNVEHTFDEHGHKDLGRLL